MVSYPPLSPSVKWFVDFTCSLSEDGNIPRAVEMANSQLPSPKEFGRFTLTDNSGNKVLLSAAVKGGGRQLRSFDKISDIKLSDHGDWRRVHFQSIGTLLHRMPYYPYLEPGLSRIYANSGITTLEAFNTAIFDEFFSFIFHNLSPDCLADVTLRDFLMERGEEIAKDWDLSESILRPLALYGKETILGLMALAKDEKLNLPAKN